MARIRTIKPEFWTSEQVMECSLNARLMFIGMWNFADDTGRLPHSAKSLKAQIFPSDEISVETIRRMLRELSSNGLIMVYAVDGKEYLQITGWQHQRIDKPQPSKYPAPFFDDSGNVLGTIPPDRKGEDSKGEERKESCPVASRPTSDDFQELKRAYPKRKGNYGWKKAEQRFNSLVRSGIDPRAIINAAKRLGETLSSRVGTEYIPMPASWMGSEDFTETATASEVQDDGMIDVLDQRALEAWDEYRRKTEGKPYPRDKKGGWRLPSKWPPGYEANIMADVEKIVSGTRQ